MGVVERRPRRSTGVDEGQRAFAMALHALRVGAIQGSPVKNFAAMQPPRQES